MILEKSLKEVSLGLEFEQVWQILQFGYNGVSTLGTNKISLQRVCKELRKLLEDIKCQNTEKPQQGKNTMVSWVNFLKIRMTRSQ